MPSHMSADMTVRSVCMEQASASSSFDPVTDVTSATCIFWSDPTKPDSCYPTLADLLLDTNRINTHGSSVGALRDYSGYLHHLVQSVAANQPLYDAIEFGGLRSLSFDGTNDFLEFVGPPLGDHPTTSSREFAVFCVARSMSTGVNSAQWAWGNTTNNIPQAYGTKSSADVLRIDLRDDATVGGSAVTPNSLDTAPHVLTWRANSTRRLVRIDNGPSGTNSTVLGAMTTNVFAMGIRKQVSLSHPFLGFISEMLIYDVDVSNSDEANIISYLRTKWGI